MESLLDKNSLICLTETQNKYLSVNFEQNTGCKYSFRNMTDKKGGGIVLIYKKDGNIAVNTEVTSGSKDVLCMICTFENFSFAIITVYLDTKDVDRNVKLMTEINKAMESINKIRNNIPLLLVGDFNAHIGIVGKQSVNANGHLVLDMMERHNFILLNADLNCDGEMTWSRGLQSSAIDFYFCNHEMYGHFENLFIDEAKEKFDLSDHHMLEARFKVTTRNKKAVYGNEYKEHTYLKINEENTNIYLNEMEKWIEERQNTGKLEDFQTAMKTISKKVMERKLRKKLCTSAYKKEEPIWFNSEIKKEISKRRQINKSVRKAANAEEKKRLWDLYLKQKWKTQKLVKEAVWKHEEKITANIKNDKDNRKLWEHIRFLKGDITKKKETVEIYNENGEKLESERVEEEMHSFWKEVYQRHENNIQEIWNTENKREYETKMAREENTYFNGIEDEGEIVVMGAQLEEHLDAVMQVPHYIVPMKDYKVTIIELKRQLKKAKEKKSPGPDGIKAELYKVMTDSEKCLTELTKCYNNIIELGVKDDGWTISNTKMIPKAVKPRAGHLRPIALTDAGYKIFMGIIKEKIKSHLERNDLKSELQAGFTRGRRISDNLFILKHCVERTFALRKSLIVISVDFQKAFDSINRKALIQTMMEFKIDAKIINIVAQIYSGDKTNIYLNDEKVTEIEITSGIRQGCNGSTVLFLLITYVLITQLQETNLGYSDNIVKIVALFFADDGLLLAENLKDATDMINFIIQSARKCGLSLNKRKSKILMFNVPEQKTDIEGIEVVDKIKYLGVIVTNKKDCFGDYKRQNIDKPLIFCGLSKL